MEWWLGIIGAARACRKRLKRMFGKSPKVSIRLAPGATYNDFRGASGEFHIHLADGTEIESSVPVVVHEYHRNDSEHIGIKVKSVGILYGPDGKEKDRRESEG